MRLIVITPEQTSPDEVRTVNRLFESGLEHLHLRKRGWSDQDYIDYVQQIDLKYHNGIVLHESFQLAERFSLGGIHLNSHSQKDEQVVAYARNLLARFTVSGSFHSWLEIEQNEVPYTYVFISPVYDSISKVGYKAGVDLAGAMTLKQQFRSEGKYCPEIVGLGGVGANEVQELLQYGFDGAAMLGSIWESEDPIEGFTQAKIVVDLLQ